ncbi:transposase [Vibrio aestuarianus]|nr:transposase [Vibrio aestuarianus]
MINQHPFMYFDVIPDYRQQGKVEHKLTDIILLTICAVLSGQDDWKAISLYGEAKLDFLKRFGDFSQGVPSTSTIARTMGMISASRLQKCFIEWMKDCCELTKGEVVAIDGKTVRGSYDDSRGLGAIHMVLLRLKMVLALANIKFTRNLMRSLPFQSCSNCLIYQVVWSQLMQWGVRRRLLKKY